MNNNYNKYFTETENGLDIEANNINANCITSQNNKFSLDSEGNLTVNSISSSTPIGGAIDRDEIFDMIYPVGAFYISASDANPESLFKGTWEKIENRFLVASGSSYSNGTTGGTTTHTHTSAAHSHGLNSHVHGAANTANGSMYAALSIQGTNGLRYKTKTGVSFTPNERKADGGAGYTYTTAQNEGVQINGATAAATGSTTSTTPGNTGSSSNIPPYLSVNIWKRVS